MLIFRGAFGFKCVNGRLFVKKEIESRVKNKRILVFKSNLNTLKSITKY